MTSLTFTQSKFFLAGKEHESKEILEVKNPYNEEVIGETFLATERDLEEAVEASFQGFQETRKLPAYRRSEILLKIRSKLENEAESFAKLMSLESGKPIKDARREVQRGILTFETAAEEAKRIGGEFLDLNLSLSAENYYGIYRPFPIGPILAITPFNFPLNLVAHKLAPALAVGSSFVLKPASKTPLTSLKLASVILESGYPEKAVNVLPCASSSGEKLVQDERFKLLSFTGSPSVGWKLKNLSGKKKVILELGGNAAVILTPDAPLEWMVKRCVAGGFSYAGQSCISVQRIFVQKTIQEKFTSLFLSEIKKLKTGNPLDEAVDLGPMISEKEALRAESWIQESVHQGAEILTGGKRKGNFLEPTVITHVTHEMKVSCQEIFAPVVIITPYEEFGDALKMVNHSDFGLQAGVFTQNLNQILQAYESLEVGGVLINEVPTWRMDPMPYGGIKNSGLGREGVKYTIQEMTEGKLLVVHQI